MPATTDGGTSDASCTVTLTGALTATYPCTVTALYAAGDGGPGTTVVGIAPVAGTSGSTSVDILMSRPGMLTSGMWTTGDPNWDVQVEVVAIAGDWASISNEPQHPNLGSFTANLTIKSAMTVSNDTFYTLTGSFTTTLIASDTTMGPVTLTASF